MPENDPTQPPSETPPAPEPVEPSDDGNGEEPAND